MNQDKQVNVAGNANLHPQQVGTTIVPICLMNGGGLLRRGFFDIY